ncbi:hypothetical protein HYFRA_00006744, partial [Hymenoscyphus fraxineus]
QEQQQQQQYQAQIAPPPPLQRPHTRSTSVPSLGFPEGSVYAITQPSPGGSGKRAMPPHPAESPAKKQSKWSAEEDALIIDLRGKGMKWEDISKRLPGRSAISCRLHYQNYLERRSEWDEERKNKLARLYERFKPEMWNRVAEEMAVPWRAAEAMHWQLGEADMARRAGVVPFSLSNVTLDAPPPGHRTSPNRGHGHSQSHSGSLSSASSSMSRFSRPATSHGVNMSSRGNVPPQMQLANHQQQQQQQQHQHQQQHQQQQHPQSRTIAARRESTPRSVPPPSPSDGIALAAIGGGGGNMSMSMGRGGGTMLPSVAEMTTGVSPYNAPAYAMSMPMGGPGGGGVGIGVAPPRSATGYSSPGPYLPPLVGNPMGMERQQEGKRRGSPGVEPRETSRRRQ